jgi:signal transduction histidine kinase
MVWNAFQVFRSGVDMPTDFENPIITKSGQERHIAWSNSTLRDESSHAIGTISFGIDISKQKRTERRLEHAAREMQQFVNVVSHDLRSPLITITGAIRMMEPNGGKMYDLAQNAILKMSKLLDDLTALARAGRVPRESKRVNLTEIAKEAVSIVAGRLNGDQVIVTDLPMVYGDPERLTQLFQNLIDNAAKFTKNGERKIEIGQTEIDGKVAYYVRDNGTGVKPENLPRLFIPFDKIDSELDGSGMGLAICRRIVESHGGHIWAESGGQDKGTTFFFTIGRPKNRTRCRQSTESHKVSGS